MSGEEGATTPEEQAPASLQVLGCGDAFASGGRDHTCFALRPAGDGGVLLVDCGATALQSMRRHGFDPADVDAVVISHLHGDHFAGLPFLILDARLNQRRERPLTLAGPPGIGDRLDAAMDIMYPGSTHAAQRFDTRVVELEPRRAVTVAGAEVEAFEVAHPSGAPAYAPRITLGGRVFAYSGDTAWVDALVEVADGADLFVCEAYFEDKRVPHHLDLRTLLENRHRLRCGRLLLTHMGSALLERLPALDVEGLEEGRRYAI